MRGERVRSGPSAGESGGGRVWVLGRPGREGARGAGRVGGGGRTSAGWAGEGGGPRRGGGSGPREREKELGLVEEMGRGRMGWVEGFVPISYSLSISYSLLFLIQTKV